MITWSLWVVLMIFFVEGLVYVATLKAGAKATENLSEALLYSIFIVLLDYLLGA